MNATNLAWHLMSAFGIVNKKAYLGLQRSDDLNPVYVSIWSAFSKCRPEIRGLYHSLVCSTCICRPCFSETFANFRFFHIFLIVDVFPKKMMRHNQMKPNHSDQIDLYSQNYVSHMKPKFELQSYHNHGSCICQILLYCPSYNFKATN